MATTKIRKLNDNSILSVDRDETQRNDDSRKSSSTINIDKIKSYTGGDIVNRNNREEWIKAHKNDALNRLQSYTSDSDSDVPDLLPNDTIEFPASLLEKKITFKLIHIKWAS